MQTLMRFDASLKLLEKAQKGINTAVLFNRKKVWNQKKRKVQMRQIGNFFKKWTPNAC